MPCYGEKVIFRSKLINKGEHPSKRKKKQQPKPMEHRANKGLLAFEGIRKGDKRTFAKAITEQDIEAFARTTGDYNPIHLDSEFAARTVFKDKIAHGILTAGLISAALSEFPGVVIYLSQSLYFRKPVRVGDKIEASAEVLEKVDERSELRLRTMCKNQKDEIVVDGEARVKVLEIEDSTEYDRSLHSFSQYGGSYM